VREEKGGGREIVWASCLMRQVRGRESLNTRVFPLAFLLFFLKEISKFFENRKLRE